VRLALANVRYVDDRLIDYSLCTNRVEAEINLQKTLIAVRACTELFEVWDTLRTNGWVAFPPHPNEDGFYYIRSAHDNVLYVELRERGDIVHFMIGSQAKRRIHELRNGSAP